MSFEKIANEELKLNLKNSILDIDFNPKNFDHLCDLSEYIVKSAKLTKIPVIGIIFGSDLGDIAEIISEKIVIPHSKIPGFKKINFSGYQGNLIFGYIGNKYVAYLQGRFNLYEHDMDMILCTTHIRILSLIGCKGLIIFNTAGGIPNNVHNGDLMLIKDHIFMPGMSGRSPLIGLNDERFGPNFISIQNAYNKKFREVAKNVANKINLHLPEGVYAMCGGPHYETPTELLLFKSIGVDAIGMSIANEVTVARQCGLRCLAFSLITNTCNLDADTVGKTSYDEISEISKKATKTICKLIYEIVNDLSL
ncbi:Purine nucleoside phosphorylase [Strongyloides ratti]|uniref:Purine nucleoside phosphorylase n=1 Tax=Strongyloides ratti TaxID=34506 RepID=A0A090L2W9_STRRB|nr:Purine nucleoside phosphorylase [Strongyloides ratti]CEF61809.1 Purine nucleoside phosphorylase [Strongyloides ratti]